MSLTSVNFYKKLDLDQREAADIFGGGVNAFSRYENGKTKPPLALVKLLKVLESHHPPKNRCPHSVDESPTSSSSLRRARVMPTFMRLRVSGGKPTSVDFD